MFSGRAALTQALCEAACDALSPCEPLPAALLQRGTHHAATLPFTRFPFIVLLTDGQNITAPVFPPDAQHRNLRELFTLGSADCRAAELALVQSVAPFKIKGYKK